MAFGNEANALKMKGKVPSNLLEGFVKDYTGKARPKFIDPKTGKPPKKVRNEVFVLDLGAPTKPVKDEFDDLYLM